MTSVGREVRHALRMLARQPAFTAVAVATHALVTALAGSSADAVQHALVEASRAGPPARPRTTT